MQESKGLTNKLMICLNFSDILSVITSITFSFNILFLYGGDNFKFTVVYLLTLIVLNISPIVSGCVTFAITLLRTIVVYNPFFQIRKRLFILCLVVTIVILIILVLILPLFFPRRLLYGGFIVVILSCLNIGMSVATIIVLKKSKIEGHRDRNYAAVTMMILSVLYFVTSFPILLTLTIPALKDDDEKKDNYIYLVMVNLSCLLNPLVYIYRKH